MAFVRSRALRILLAVVGVLGLGTLLGAEPHARRRVDLGRFHLPAAYRGEWRVDTHPRLSRDGRLVCIDAPQENQGRQLHLIDISQIVDA